MILEIPEQFVGPLRDWLDKRYRGPISSNEDERMAAKVVEWLKDELRHV
jgi:hypothetical protein